MVTPSQSRGNWWDRIQNYPQWRPDSSKKKPNRYRKLVDGITKMAGLIRVTCT